jgi:hypothetical protein
MNKYGAIAVEAAELVRAGKCRSATEAWETVATAAFPDQVASQDKGCPRGAFLGLCEEGLVLGVSAQRATRPRKNKEYALAAVWLLQAEPVLAEEGATALWDRVMGGREKDHNSQMDVVLALWHAGLLNRDAVSRLKSSPGS